MERIYVRTPTIAGSIRRILGSTVIAALLSQAGASMAAPCKGNDVKRCDDGVNWMSCTGIGTGTRWDDSQCANPPPQPKGPFPWLIKGTYSAPSATEISVNRTPAPGWTLAGVGDFNGDGQPDFLYRRSNDTGEARIWFMQNQTVVRDVAVARTPAPGWTILGVGDFNGDGKADIVWRRTNGTMEARVWYLTSEYVLNDVAIGVPPIGAQLLGIGDLDGDGKSDLVWGFKPSR